MKTLRAALLGLAYSFLGFAATSADPPEPIGEPPVSNVIHSILTASVCVKAEGGSGSGVCFHNGPHAFIWTDAHVVDTSLKVANTFDPKTGRKVPRVRFADVELLQEDFADGRKVGYSAVYARVIRYSERHDIAVLKPYKKWPAVSVEFAQAVTAPGTPLWHVGSMQGARGVNSLSAGHFSTAGRLRHKFKLEELDDPILYDQISLTGLPGSSGGGVFLKDGRCVGLITEFIGPNQTFGAMLLSPARRLAEFARENKCVWALDANVPVPVADDVHPFVDGTISLLPEPTPAP